MRQEASTYHPKDTIKGLQCREVEKEEGFAREGAIARVTSVLPSHTLRELDDANVSSASYSLVQPP